jgi:hypothetical protein
VTRKISLTLAVYTTAGMTSKFLKEPKMTIYFIVVFFIVLTGKIFADFGPGLRIINYVGNSTESELGEVGAGFQFGVKFGKKEEIVFPILVDIRYFGIPQITCGLITGVNFKLGELYIGIDAGGGFANSKFTTLFSKNTWIPYVRGMLSGGIDLNGMPVSLGLYYDHYFDSSAQELFDLPFRTGVFFSINIWSR